MIKKRLVLGCRVKHDFSLTEGTYTARRKVLGGYDYYIEWDKGFADWYQRKVLIVL